MSKKIIVCFVAVVLIFIAIILTIKVSKNVDISEKDISEINLIEINSVKNINIDVECGDIEVICEDREDLETEFSAKSSNGKLNVESNINGDTLNIKVTEPKSGINISKDIVLSVRVPKLYNHNLKVNDTAGNIKINQLNLKDVTINASCGNVNMSNVQTNNFELNSLGGNFIASSLHTNSSILNCKTGSINVTDFSGNLKSVLEAGETNIEYTEFNNNLDVSSTFGGNINVKLTKASEFSLEADCSNGKINSEFLMSKIVDQRENYIKGLIGSDKSKVKLYTVAGNIQIKK